MRIAIDIRLLARGGTTGIPGYTRELVNELILNHPEHEYVLFYNAFRRNPLPSFWRTAKNVTIIEKSIPNRLLNLSYKLFNAPKLKIKADVFFSPHFNLLPELNIPRAITFHDLSFLHYPDFFSKEQMLWHNMQQYKEQAKKAAHLIAVSSFTKNDLVNLLGLRSEKISVVYSGISSEFKKLAPDDSGLTRYRNTNKLTKPFILYFGTVEARKNPIVLIRAFEQLKSRSDFAGYELVLAGQLGFGDSEIKKEIISSAVAKDIRLLGRIPDKERVYLYNLARAFVLPSFMEGFGFPPLEAEACEVPVITSGRTSLGEVLETTALEFNPWRPAELADSIALIETNKNLRETMIREGAQNASRFTWAKTAEQTLAVLEKAANGPVRQL